MILKAVYIVLKTTRWQTANYKGFPRWKFKNPEKSNKLRHSFRLNAEVVARAWQILGSLVWRVNIILQVLILLLYVPCMKLTKNVKKKTGLKSLFFRPIKFFIKVAHLWLCATFLSYLGGSVEAFRSKIAQIGVHNV